MLLYFIIILLIISYCCEVQNEIRNAVKAKTKRKLQKGKQAFRNVKNRARAPIHRTNKNINRKYQKTRRKFQAIEDIIQS
jgi:hypothetical protein